MFYVPDSICDFLAYRNNASINHDPNSPPTCSPTAARFVYKARKFQTHKEQQLCTSYIIINRIHIWQFWQSWIISFLKGTNWNKSCIQEFISVGQLFWVQCSHKLDLPIPINMKCYLFENLSLFYASTWCFATLSCQTGRTT